MLTPCSNRGLTSNRKLSQLLTDQRSYCHIPVGNGQHKKLTKSFDKKSEAKRWALENELEKGNGKQLAERSTTFAVYFENWIYIIKKNDVKETTFQITNVLRQVLLNDFLVTFS